MALTVDQQQDIVYFLGLPGKCLINTSVEYDSEVLARLTNTIIQIENQAIDLITKIKALDVTLVAASARFIASQVGDIKINAEEAPMLRKERRIYIRQLSALLDIPCLGGSGMISVSI